MENEWRYGSIFAAVTVCRVKSLLLTSGASPLMKYQCQEDLDREFFARNIS